MTRKEQLRLWAKKRERRERCISTLIAEQGVTVAKAKLKYRELDRFKLKPRPAPSTRGICDCGECQKCRHRATVARLRAEQKERLKPEPFDRDQWALDVYNYELSRTYYGAAALCAR
ncbi:MAG TPA: hypothetical protein VM223_11260 [Planctomycetota bacterium]|nr:hypothetical protein [Planctomycetota bacterium]